MEEEPPEQSELFQDEHFEKIKKFVDEHPSLSDGRK